MTLFENCTSIEELGNRRVLFHYSAPPKAQGKCDKCGGELLLRDDDKPETVQHRLEVYHAETEPLKDFYAQRGILKPVENQPTIEETNVLVMKALEA